MISGGPNTLDRVGMVLELLLGFLLLPLVVCTLDRPPLWMGGRILIWVALVFLVVRMPRDARARMHLRVRPTRALPGGWVGPIALFLLSVALLSLLLKMMGVWAPPPLLETGGMPAYLLLALLSTLFVVVPLELLFRVYVPMRFRGLIGKGTPGLVALSSLLFAWMHLPSFQPLVLVAALVLGFTLALMERAGWPFWGTLGLHGLALWAWTVSPALFQEAWPWTA
ncbi:MAG: CPBP family intramembrane metalloprotease [Fibrobacteria bacterium]|nr:CPBP family intramembrane metalloprotease [Fibrobacteria bacterium]